MKVFLCGQTGSMNRGCEAIVRSTVKVLNRKNGNIYVATHAPEQDRAMCREMGISLIAYAGYPTLIHRYASVVFRKINRKSLAGMKYIEKPLISRIGTEDLCLSIGGDTYCYGRPIGHLALTKYTYKKGIKNILWCCSIEKEKICGEILEDLKRYDYIFARESLTFNNLIETGIEKEKVVKCCDPAFFLEKKKVPLPQGFVAGNTVGINVSEMVINDTNPKAYENVLTLIQYILDKTDMAICLIPHVYNIVNNSNDFPILKRIKAEMKDARISMVSEEYDCEQLKYIISNCRFFVGARTHSTIAAYSSYVPTLVLGYSIKSKGIATDLFGTYDGYVLPYDELKERDTLTNAFINIQKNEKKIKTQYLSIIPQYKDLLTEAIKKYIFPVKNTKKEKFDICDITQCTGCSVCESICPQNCITMNKMDGGFLYPVINYDECIHCGKCVNICPVRNKYKEDNHLPKAYAAFNKDEDIRKSSSSGGIFTLLAEKIIQKDGSVYGPVWDENFVLKHVRITSLEDIEKMRGSKYVQSQTKGIYPKVQKDLIDGKMVLFSGTPCQIGGLYAYLGKDYANLYTQDIICHGVSSPEIWLKYIKYCEDELGSGMKSVSFRDKRTGWKHYSITLTLLNSVEYSKVLTENYFMRGFLSHLFIRKSCTECSFKNVHRQADITLGDFWGIEKYLPEWNDDKGVTAIMIHSEKGKNLLNEILEYAEVQMIDYTDVIKENRSALVSVRQNPLSDKFYEDATKIRFDRIIEKYCGMGIGSRIRRKIARMMQ